MKLKRRSKKPRNIKYVYIRHTHPVPDSLAGSAQRQPEPAQKVEVEAAAVAAFRVLGTDIRHHMGAEPPDSFKEGSRSPL